GASGDDPTIAEIVRQCRARDIPVIAYRDGPPAADPDETAPRAIRGRQARSTERLLDQAALLLHRRIESLDRPRREVIEKLYSPEAVLAGKRVLIVDDDIRNIFAMTSVLERQNMAVVTAETGKEAIEKLSETGGIDIVLMDVMMPDMDGYDTMRAIRKIGRFRDRPT